MFTSTIGSAPAERRVYAAWFDGLLMRALRDRLTPALRADLLKLGLDLSKPLAEHYLATVRLECLLLVRTHLFEGKTDDHAWHELGSLAVEGYLQTLVGQAFALVYRLLGPRSLMKRGGAVMASTSNYISAETIERAPFRWELRLEGADLPPAYYVGMMTGALQYCGVKSAQVLLVSHLGQQLVLSCSWAPPVSTR